MATALVQLMGKHKDPEYLKKYYQANKQKFKDKSVEWKKANPDKIVESGRRRYVKIQERVKSMSEEQQQLYKEERVEKAHLWRKANPEKAAAKAASRRATELQQMPSWVRQCEIRGFYEMSARVSKCLGIPHHVDHIIPLRGKTVRGLHVPANLRVIPATMNMRKGNRLIEELL